MPWSGFSQVAYELLKAQEQVDHTIEQTYGLTYEFDMMEYATHDDEIVSSERIATIRRELMRERGYLI